MLTPFVAGNSMSWYAALQQAALCRAVYTDSPVEEVVRVARAAGPTVLVHSNPTPPDWNLDPAALPAYVLFDQGEEYWLVIQGTYTAGQWLSNATGAFRTGVLGENAGVFQGQWAESAAKVVEGIGPFIEVDERPVNVTGHSMGGAVAWMVAALLRQTTATRVVRVMTFASPRPEQGAYSGVPPANALDVQLGLDPVVKLPPNPVIPVGNVWTQQGTKYVLSPAGAVLRNTYNDGELTDPTALLTTSFQNHLISTYATAILAYYQQQLPFDDTTNAVLLASGLLAGSAAPFVSVAPLTNLGGPMNFKVEMDFGYKKWSWRDTHYWNGRSYDECLSDVRSLASLRLGCLSTLCSLEAIVLHACDNTGNTFAVGGGEVIYGPGPTGKGKAPSDGNAPTCSPPWRAALVALYSAERLYRRQYLIRGITNTLGCQDVPDWVNGLPNQTGRNKEAMDAYLCFLCNGNCPANGFFRAGTAEEPAPFLSPAGPQPRSSPAPVGSPVAAPTTGGARPIGVWSFRVRNRAVGRGNAYQILDLLIDADGALWIKPGKQAGVTVNPQQGTLVLGQRIHVHGLGPQGLVGLNGDATVLQVGTAAPYIGFYRLSTCEPAECGFHYLGGATYWHLANIIVPYGFARYARIVNKKTGVVKFGTKGKGRKAKKKCR